MMNSNCENKNSNILECKILITGKDLHFCETLKHTLLSYGFQNVYIETSKDLIEADIIIIKPHIVITENLSHDFLISKLEESPKFRSLSDFPIYDMILDPISDDETDFQLPLPPDIEKSIAKKLLYKTDKDIPEKIEGLLRSKYGDQIVNKEETVHFCDLKQFLNSDNQNECNKKVRCPDDEPHQLLSIENIENRGIFEKKILIADCEELICDSFREVLTEKGWSDISIALDGYSAHKMTDEFQPDLIITDYFRHGINEMKGEKLFKLLRANSLSHPPAIILHTAYTSKDAICPMCKWGLFDTLIAKPLTLEKLLGTVVELLQERELQE